MRRPRSGMRPSAITTMRAKVGDDLHVVADHDDGASALGPWCARFFHDGHALAVVKAARGLVEHDDLGPTTTTEASATICRWPRESENGASSAGRPKRSMTSWARRRLGTVDAGKLQAKGDLVEHGILADLAVGVFGRGSRPRGQCGSWERLQYPVP